MEAADAVPAAPTMIERIKLLKEERLRAKQEIRAKTKDLKNAQRKQKKMRSAARNLSPAELRELADESTLAAAAAAAAAAG